MSKVLLIESDKLLAGNLAQALKRAGHSTAWHVDLQSAVNSIDASMPDAVILDLALAGRSGVEFLYELRSYPEWQDLPIIIWSNLAAEEEAGLRPAFGQLSVAAYHHKPSTPLNRLLNSLDLALNPV